MESYSPLPQWGRRLLTPVAALVLVAALAAPVTPGASGQTSSGFLTWGVKESFRQYVTGPIAHGSISVSGGATKNADGTFRFPAAPGGSATASSFLGAVRFSGHDGKLDLSVANLRIQLTGNSGTLFADVTD